MSLDHRSSLLCFLVVLSFAAQDVLPAQGDPHLRVPDFTSDSNQSRFIFGNIYLVLQI